MAGIETYTIKAIRIYPLKSAGWLDLDSAFITNEGVETADGLVQDHQLFLTRGTTNPQGFHEAITQRDKRNVNDKNEKAQSFAELALIKPSIQNRKLVLSFNGDEISIPKEGDDLTRVVPVKVWEYEGAGLEVPALSEWASDHLKYQVRAVRTAGPWDRMSRQDYIQNFNPLRAQDGYPVHALLYEDVLEMSKEAGKEIPWNRFRPQILLEGQPAWSLHQMFRGEIKGVDILQPKPCGRCETTQVDQERGNISRLKPLAQLKKIRPRWIDRYGQPAQIVGENWLPLGVIEVAVGNKLMVTQKRSPLTYES